MTLISNPLGAHRTVTTFVANADSRGEALIQPEVTRELRAAAAVTVGQVLQYTAPTATVPLSVEPMATASAAVFFAGVALNNAAAGEMVHLVPPGGGIVRVRTGDVTTQLGDRLVKPGSTAGVGTIVDQSGALAATDVIGTVLGIVVGNDDGTFTPVDLARSF
jgi:hypothetical protein